MVLIVAGVMKSMGENDPERSAYAQSAPHSGWWRSACVRFYEVLAKKDSVQPVDLILVLAGQDGAQTLWLGALPRRGGSMIGTERRTLRSE